MTQKLIILGVGGNCLEIVDAVRAASHQENAFEVIGFLDDSPAALNERPMSLPVLGPLADAKRFEECLFVNGIGSPQSFVHKAQIIACTGMPPERFATVVHPKAEVASTAVLGAGTVVLANSTVGANARLDTHVMVLAGTTIGHDCVIGPRAVLASGVVLCGQVTLAADCYIGAGAVIRGGVNVGSHSLVGAGSVAVSDVPAQTVVCGNPAKALRKMRID